MAFKDPASWDPYPCVVSPPTLYHGWPEQSVKHSRSGGLPLPYWNMNDTMASIFSLSSLLPLSHSLILSSLCFSVSSLALRKAMLWAALGQSPQGEELKPPASSHKSAGKEVLQPQQAFRYLQPPRTAYPHPHGHLSQWDKTETPSDTVWENKHVLF